MHRLRLLAAVLVAMALSMSVISPATAQPRKWPKGRITYVDQSRDHDSVKRAVKIWNSSGLKVRFIKVKRAKKARLIIRNTKVVPDGCGSGYGTLGNPGPRRKAHISILHGTAKGGQGCAWPGKTLVVAHELGHVLGLTHYMKGCALMNTSHTNGVAQTLCLGDEPDAARPGRWNCRVLQKPDLKRVKRMYGGKPRLRNPEWCDAIDRIPATGPMTVAEPFPGWFSVSVTRAAEPAVPDWLGTWGFAEPGYDIYATPGACTATPGDDATRMGAGLWAETPAGGALSTDIGYLPAGPVCLTAWQFDRGFNFATQSTSLMVTGTGQVSPSARVKAPTQGPIRVHQID